MMASKEPQPDVELGLVSRDRVFRARSQKTSSATALSLGSGLTVPELELLGLLAGGDVSRIQEEGTHVIGHLKTQISHNQNLDLDLCTNFRSGQDRYDCVVHLSCAMVRIIRDNHGISIARILQRLQQEQYIYEPNGEDGAARARHLMFSIIGWLSHLYVPTNVARPDLFQIDTQGAKCPVRNAVSTEKSQRPIDELLRAFGEIIPKRGTLNMTSSLFEPRSSDSAALKFHVSNLNAATLHKLAGIQLVWVDTIGPHLDFDPTVPAIYLFRLPSFCKVQSFENSFLSTLTQELLIEEEKLDGDDPVSQLMKEILLSYVMLFRDDRLARKLYRRMEREKACIVDSAGNHSIDPGLDKLCGLDLSTSLFTFNQPVRETYHADSDFPILQKRLNRLQLYINGIEPSRTTSLWRDRRDLRLWYTIWAVLVIGGISIIQAFISIFLSAAQVGISEKALELQQKSSPR